MTLELPFEMGEKLYVVSSGRIYDAELTGYKISADKSNTAVHIRIYGQFGCRTYNAAKISRTIFKNRRDAERSLYGR
ncbi:MAG: hypothetical protein IJ711_00085 [Lachnospiraceae bacterium]|nr:hypothetical protein [Clostridia bacterium]MBR1691153.1 hypothetical protein [Lachnospiraceae bacterium]